MAIGKKTYDIFITHAWRYHEEWTKMCDLLDGTPALRWRNFSLPWHDPAMDANSPVGNAFIRNFLETQVIPVHGVILLAGVYAINSAKRWLDLEIEFARNHRKPIVAVPALGETLVPREIASLCDRNAAWDAEQIIATLEEVRAELGNSGRD